MRIILLSSLFFLLFLPTTNFAQAPDLGSAGTFVLFTASGAVSNTGISHFKGNIGTNLGAINNFDTLEIEGRIYNSDSVTARCSADLQFAYNQLYNTVATFTSHPPAFGSGETLTPGVYSIAAAASVAAILNLDAEGDSNAVFIFKIGGAFTTGASTTIVLVNKASARNIFWVAEGAVAMAASTIMKGTLISNNGAISLGANGDLEGRMFSTTGAVAINNGQAYLPTDYCISNSWTGSINTDWNKPGNWLGNIIPGTTNSITIPGGLMNYPVLDSANGSVNNITIDPGALLTVISTLKVAGSITNNGAITASDGTIEFNGNASQTLTAGIFTNNTIQNLVLSNNVVLTGPLLITGAVSFGNVNNKVLTTGGFLNLVSSAVATAWVADITNNSVNVGNSICGSATVERYLSSKFNRAYRLLGPSVTTTTSIHSNWQEGASASTNNPNRGFGTHITGTTVDQANGFDGTITGQGSMFTYDQVSSAWVPATNTDSSVLNALTGYLIYIRGDRTIDLGSQSTTLPTTDVTLRATGNLLTGTQTFSGLAGNGEFSLITNPFAAPINWTTVRIAGTNITNAYTLWDPNFGTRGGYVTVNSSGVASAGVATQHIQSGQAFFVQASAAATATVTIGETDKSSTNNISVFSPASPLQKFSISLHFKPTDVTSQIADGAVAIYNDSYTAVLDDNDAEEIPNWDENIALARSGQNLSIESRPPIAGYDTLFIFMNHLKMQNYRFVFASTLDFPGITAELVDQFSHTRTMVSLVDTTVVSFNVSATQGSAASNRFYIVFKPASVLPLTFTTLKAYRKTNGTQVEWITQSGNKMDRYEIEKSTNGRSFIKTGLVKAMGNDYVSPTYKWFDAEPYYDVSYYRIKSVDKNGEVNLSPIVRLAADKVKDDVIIYPNPVTGNILNFHVKQLVKGSYRITIVNSSGQRVFSESLDHPGGSLQGKLDIQPCAPGIYRLKIEGEGVMLTAPVLIQFDAR